MDSANHRLTRCFAAVFPGLSPDAIHAATLETVSAWDSMAMVTLVAVIEGEFGVSFDLNEIELLKSYDAVLNQLTRKAGA
jgi:acyl carrier protein